MIFLTRGQNESSGDIKEERIKTIEIPQNLTDFANIYSQLNIFEEMLNMRSIPDINEILSQSDNEEEIFEARDNLAKEDALLSQYIEVRESLKEALELLIREQDEKIMKIKERKSEIKIDLLNLKHFQTHNTSSSNPDEITI